MLPVPEPLPRTSSAVQRKGTLTTPSGSKSLSLNEQPTAAPVLRKEKRIGENLRKTPEQSKQYLTFSLVLAKKWVQALGLLIYLLHFALFIFRFVLVITDPGYRVMRGVIIIYIPILFGLSLVSAMVQILVMFARATPLTRQKTGYFRAFMQLAIFNFLVVFDLGYLIMLVFYNSENFKVSIGFLNSFYFLALDTMASSFMITINIFIDLALVKDFLRSPENLMLKTASWKTMLRTLLATRVIVGLIYLCSGLTIVLVNLALDCIFSFSYIQLAVLGALTVTIIYIAYKVYTRTGILISAE